MLRTRTFPALASLLLLAALLAGCAGGGGGDGDESTGDGASRTDDPGWAPEGIEAPNPYAGGDEADATDNETPVGGATNGTATTGMDETG